MSKIAALKPHQPSKPIALPFSPTQLLVCWSLPRSHGAQVTGFGVQCRRVLMSKHPDETESDDSEPAEPRPFGGPLGRANVYKPPKSKWRQVVVAEYVEKATRIQEPLCKTEVDAGGRDIELVNGIKMTLEQQQAVLMDLEPGRRWAYAVVGGFKPCSHHAFRVQSSNVFGRSKFSDPSEPGVLPPDVPVVPISPYPEASSPTVIVLYWIEPCHNGIETAEYQIQRQRVYTSGPEDSESDEEENDTAAWMDACLAPVGDVLGSFRMTGAPDIVKLLGVRGKRRFGRRCSIPVPDLRPGKTYRFRIRAWNEIGWSGYSAPSSECRTICE